MMKWTLGFWKNSDRDERGDFEEFTGYVLEYIERKEPETEIVHNTR